MKLPEQHAMLFVKKFQLEEYFLGYLRPISLGRRAHCRQPRLDVHQLRSVEVVPWPQSFSFILCAAGARFLDFNAILANVVAKPASTIEARPR